MAERGRSGTALPDEKVLALAWVYLVALALSLLGSGSIVAASLLRRRCCQEQLCPLFLLSLADLLGASALLSAAAIQLLPQRLFVSAYQACPYLLMLGLMFYAISLLVVVVYAYEVKRTLGGWREAPSSALLEEESSRFNERLQTNLPRLLAWLLPFLVFVVLLVMRGSSLRDVAPWTIPPVALQAGNRSQGSYGLYCSSCLVLIHHSQDTCYKYTGRKDSGKEGKIFFLVFISLVVVCCTVLYCRVKCWCRRRQRGGPPLNLPAPESDGCAGRTRTTRSACFFQLVFLVCWMPGPDHLPARLLAQPGLRMVPAELPPGGDRGADAPPGPPGPESLLRGLPGHLQGGLTKEGKAGSPKNRVLQNCITSPSTSGFFVRVFCSGLLSVTGLAQQPAGSRV
nr:uncharacterized protein LOC118090886 isoform X1 [Zootoca vivipara]